MILDIRYAAGLFDGEGWFYINKSVGLRMKRGKAFQVYAGLGMREKIIIDSLMETFGGSVTVLKPKKEQHSIVYQWNVVGTNCLAFAKLIRPFLIAKSKQADLVITFQQEKIFRGNRPMTDEQAQAQEDAFLAMKHLNKRGVGK